MVAETTFLEIGRGVFGLMAREMNIGTSAPKAGALPLGDAPKELSFIDSTQLYQPLIFLFPNAYYHALFYIGSRKVTPSDAKETPSV